jgi:hypothetical protein
MSTLGNLKPQQILLPTEDEPVVVFSASPVTVLAKRKRGIGKKYPTPFVETGLTRSKRTCVRQPGYRPKVSGAHFVTNDEPPSAVVKIVEILEDGNGQAGGHTEVTR